MHYVQKYIQKHLSGQDWGCRNVPSFYIDILILFCSIAGTLLLYLAIT